MSTTAPSNMQTTGVEDVVVNLATRIGILLSGVAIQSLLAYVLLPAGRGEFAVCILFAALVSVLLTPGADAGSQYFVMTKKINVTQRVAVSLAICLVGAVAASAIAIPLINSEIAFFQKAETTSFSVALALIPLTALSNALQHQFAGLRRFKVLAVLLLAQTSANGIALLCLVALLRFGVVGALLASCVGNLIMITACLRDLRRNAELTIEVPSRSALERVLRYGLKYYIARIGWGVDVRFGLLLLSLLAERAKIGLFAVASGLMMRFVIISNAIFVPLLPRTALDRDGRPDLVAFCARMTTWITGAALILLLAFHVPVVRILLSAGFLPAVSLIRIIAPGILVFAGGNLLTAYFRGIGRPDVCSWAVAFGLGINLVVVPLLYPKIGVEAAAWAMTLGLVGRSALLCAVYCRMTRTNPSFGWMPQRRDIPSLLQFVCTGIARALHRSRVNAA